MTALDLSSIEKALEFYAENGRLCRLIHSEGDPGRWALSADGGDKAREALSALLSLARQAEEMQRENETLKALLRRAEECIIDAVTAAKSEAEMNDPYPSRKPRFDDRLAEARKLYADVQSALTETNADE